MTKTPPAPRLAVLVALALACAHAGGAGAEGGASSGAVTLKFAWPDGFQSFVLLAHESRKTGGEPTVFFARERLVTERKGDDIFVYTREIQARGNEPDLDTTVKMNEALVQVVARDGTFRRAEGVDEALAAMKSTTPEERANARVALARSTSFDWEVLVGAWNGQTLHAGDVRRKQVRSYLPELAGVEALLDVEYGVEGRVPCTDEDTARRCVELSYRARLAPGDRAATLARVRRFVTTGDEKAVPEDVHGDLEIVLVTEPDTLVPHRMTQREHLRLRLTLPDGHVGEMERRSDDTYVFSDREPRPKPPGDAPQEPQDV